MVMNEYKGKLLIQKISPKPSGIMRYNQTNYKKPLIEGDTIVAVDGKEAVKDMVAVLKTKEKFTLSVVRSGNVANVDVRDRFFGDYTNPLVTESGRRLSEVGHAEKSC